MRIAASVAVACLLAACGGGDAPIPPAYASKVEDARSSLEGNWEGLPRPSFSFLSIRCREDGGLMIVFIEHGGRHNLAFAVAMSGPDAIDGPGGWGGGYGIPNVDADGETVFWFSESPETACPAVPA